MSKKIRHCNICGLPETFPGITIDDINECNLCKQERIHPTEKIPYLGIDALKKDVHEINNKIPSRNTKYDGVVALSGGRDSTYLLYVLKELCNFNVLAVTLKHNYLPQDTIDNIDNTCLNMGVDHIYVENNYLNKYADYFISKWSNNPRPQTLIGFCTGCRYGLNKLIPKIAADNHIFIYFNGMTRHEFMPYRKDIVNINPDKPSKAGLLLGYGRELLTNLSLLSSPQAIKFQCEELLSEKRLNKTNSDLGVSSFFPFKDYYEWTEESVSSTLKTIGWKRSEKFEEDWRSDCYINIIRQYYYDRLLGYNDFEAHNSFMIRHHIINKSDLHDKPKIDDNIIRELLKDKFDLDFDTIEKKLKPWI